VDGRKLRLETIFVRLRARVVDHAVAGECKESKAHAASIAPWTLGRKPGVRISIVG
jgi:hypothetical protein